MKLNIGRVDRILRISIGLAGIVLAMTKTIGPWGWLGALLIGSALVGYCPAYHALKVSTHKVSR